MNINWQDLKEWAADHRKTICGIIAVFIAAAGFLFLNNKVGSKHQAQLLKPQTERTSALNSSSSSVNSAAAGSSQAEKIFVDIKGAVEEPGVYRIGINERVSNVIQRAGGLKKNADIKKVNLAEKLTDQTVIYIPKKGEKRLGDYVSLGGQQNQPDQPSSQENTSSSSSLINEGGSSGTSQTAGADSSSNPSQSTNNKVNLNTAQKADLMKLTGIGDKKADQILAYRQQHGRFKTIDEIKQVSGIGDKTFLSLKDQLCV